MTKGVRPVRSTLPSTRRLPLAAGAVLTAVAVATLGACTSSGSSDGADGDGKTGPVTGGSVSSAPPGKYRTLPQPCTSVDTDSLKKLVPGLQDYSGAESLTYDTDRLVGCSWKVKAADGTSRLLSLSLVRVVSYDPSVSDEAQASSDFDKRAQAASIPSTPPGGSPSTTSPTTPTTSSSTGTANSGSNGSAGTSGSSATSGAGGNSSSGSGAPSSTGSSDDAIGANDANTGSPDLAPRLLSGVGNAAFINDVAKKPGKGASRTVTLVFRTANVLATVTYTQSSPTDAQPPKSADLQKGAEKVASDLQHKVEG
ncbi:hypothetical protein [Streptomyces sp. NBC_00448]|uniref:hypothetical protein n=1 Tax=Streptomyces sp. NBC_00448 TaxID=2903652 RepID=UPI002E1D4E40